ncbi:MAG: MTH938/NDUFAF3 family protein, partial [Mariprofundaceae bacterium]|nr:MTH938/NDUFAF3 family protein [Mariprofundaceae bacterium]
RMGQQKNQHRRVHQKAVRLGQSKRRRNQETGSKALSPTLPGDVTPELDADTPVFRAYDDTSLQIGNDRFNTGLLVHHGHVIAPWGPERISGLMPEHLAHILESPPQVLLIGTGRTTSFPNAAVFETLETAHIGVECMDTRAAARTYNILVAEGRHVAAAMLPPGV